MPHDVARMTGSMTCRSGSTLLLAWVRYHLTTPEHSYVGRYSGGFMIHAIALMETWQQQAH